MECNQDAGNYMSIRYEDVCRNPEAGTRTMFGFAGLRWSDQTARFVGASTASERESYYSVYKDPLRAANKWREELSRDEIRRVLAVVEDSPLGGVYADSQDEATA